MQVREKGVQGPEHLSGGLCEAVVLWGVNSISEVLDLRFPLDTQLIVGKSRWRSPMLWTQQVNLTSVSSEAREQAEKSA